MVSGRFSRWCNDSTIRGGLRGASSAHNARSFGRAFFLTGSRFGCASPIRSCRNQIALAMAPFPTTRPRNMHEKLPVSPKTFRNRNDVEDGSFGFRFVGRQNVLDAHLSQLLNR